MGPLKADALPIFYHTVSFVAIQKILHFVQYPVDAFCDVFDFCSQVKYAPCGSINEPSKDNEHANFESFFEHSMTQTGGSLRLSNFHNTNEWNKKNSCLMDPRGGGGGVMQSAFLQ